MKKPLERKDPEQIAREIDELYGDNPIGSELYEILAEKARENNGLNMESVKEELKILRGLRVRSAA
jgi:hypothetical protein